MLTIDFDSRTVSRQVCMKKGKSIKRFSKREHT